MWHDRSSAVNVAVSSHHPHCVHATFCLDGTISGLTYGTRRVLCRMVAKNKESVGELTIIGRMSGMESFVREQWDGHERLDRPGLTCVAIFQGEMACFRNQVY